MLTHRNMLSDIANAMPEARQPLPRRRLDAAVPAAGALVRPADPDRHACRPGSSSGTPPTSRTWSASCRSSADVRPVGAPGVREGLQHRPAAGARRRQGRDLRPGRAGRDRATARRWTRRSGPGLALRVQHALFDRLVYGKLRAALGGRCTAAISGGAPLGARLAHFFRGIGVTVQEGYGLTETSPAVAVNLHTATRIGTVGRPLPGVTVAHRRRRRGAGPGRHRLRRLLEQPRRRPPRPSTPTAGSTPATSASWTTTAT